MNFVDAYLFNIFLTTLKISKGYPKDIKNLFKTSEKKFISWCHLREILATFGNEIFLSTFEKYMKNISFIRKFKFVDLRLVNSNLDLNVLKNLKGIDQVLEMSDFEIFCNSKIDYKFIHNVIFLYSIYYYNDSEYNSEFNSDFNSDFNYTDICNKIIKMIQTDGFDDDIFKHQNDFDKEYLNEMSSEMLYNTMAMDSIPMHSFKFKQLIKDAQTDEDKKFQKFQFDTKEILFKLLIAHIPISKKLLQYWIVEYMECDLLYPLEECCKIYIQKNYHTTVGVEAETDAEATATADVDAEFIKKVLTNACLEENELTLNYFLSLPIYQNQPIILDLYSNYIPHIAKYMQTFFETRFPQFTNITFKENTQIQTPIWTWWAVGGIFPGDSGATYHTLEIDLLPSIEIDDQFKKFKTIDDIKTWFDELKEMFNSPTSCYFKLDHEIFLYDQQSCLIWALEETTGYVYEYKRTNIHQIYYVAKSLAEFLTRLKIEEICCREYHRDEYDENLVKIANKYYEKYCENFYKKYPDRDAEQDSFMTLLH